MFLKRLNTRGDTIVEVLIALTLIASTLGVAFAIANRSSATIQTDNERYQAQLIANEQAALLRAYAPISGNTPIAGAFCMLSTTEKTVDTDPDCTKSSLYKVSVTGCAAAGYCVYRINIQWSSFTSSTPNNLDLYYGT